MLADILVGFIVGQVVAIGVVLLISTRYVCLRRRDLPSGRLPWDWPLRLGICGLLDARTALEEENKALRDYIAMQQTHQENLKKGVADAG